MKNRVVKLADGTTKTIDDNDWLPVVNRKEFDDKETEILRITKHKSGLISRVYVMRSVNGKIVAEQNEIIVADDPTTAAAKAISDLGLTRISVKDIQG